MLKLRTVFAIICAAFLAACATEKILDFPTDDMVKKVMEKLPGVFTPPASSDEILKAIKGWSFTGLKDPEAMRIRDEHSLTAQKGWVKACYTKNAYIVTDCFFFFGHVVKASMNAKNANGGYIGYEDTYFVLSGSSVTKAIFHKDYVSTGTLP